MSSIDEIIASANKKIEKQKRLKRLTEKHKREEKKKKDSRRCYIIGEFFTKHFPDILYLEPGTKAENAVEFETVDLFFSTLAENQELRT